jgi:hypothetical protein
LKRKLQGKLSWVVIGLIVGSLFGGVAVATITIPNNSVGWKSLTKGLQKRLSKKFPKSVTGPAGAKGEKGDTGAQGPAGKAAEPPEQAKLPGLFVKSLAVSSVGGDSAILEADINTEGAEGGVYYQFQLVTDPAEFRPELSCPQGWGNPPVIQCLGALLTGGSVGSKEREPDDLPTRDLEPSAEDQHVRLEVQGLDPQAKYHYRVVVVEAVPPGVAVDTIQWFAPPTHSPAQSFTTTDFDEPRAYGLVGPDGAEELKRSRNAELVEPEGNPTGIWCIKAEGIDPEKMIVHLSAAEEPHVSVGGNEVPVVRWRVVPNDCDEGEVEVETAVYDEIEGYERTDFQAFTFVIEEVD